MICNASHNAGSELSGQSYNTDEIYAVFGYIVVNNKQIYIALV